MLCRPTLPRLDPRQLAGPPSAGPGSRGWYSGRSFALANAAFTAAESAVMSYAP